MHVKCTCVPAGARNSTVFRTSVLFARSRCDPGGISHVNVCPYSSSATCFPSSEKSTCRCCTSCSDVRWIVRRVSVSASWGSGGFNKSETTSRSGAISVSIYRSPLTVDRSPSVRRSYVSGCEPPTADTVQGRDAAVHVDGQRSTVNGQRSNEPPVLLRRVHIEKRSLVLRLDLHAGGCVSAHEIPGRRDRGFGRAHLGQQRLS